MLLRRIAIPAFLFCAPLAAQAPQDSLEEEQAAPPGDHADALGIARAAAAKGDAAEALSQYLRALSAQPNNVEALAGAGRAALQVGDVNAATGFFGRADSLAPNNGPVKAGLASAQVQGGNARIALRYFRQAQALGVPEVSMAADRGLAYDLNGEGKKAQIQYRLLLMSEPANPIALRRLALSQAIGGDVAGALVTLDPLLRKQDVPAWRTRAFAKAIGGDVAGAEQDAAYVLPANQVAALRPYLARLAALKTPDKAAAVFLGRFPQAGKPAATVASNAPPPSSVFSLGSRSGSRKAAQLPITTPPPVLPQVAPGAPAIGSTADVMAVATATPAPESTVDRIAHRADTRAEQRKRVEAAKALAEAREKKANPARHWVQVAGGANKRDLPRAWAALKAKWGSQLSGKSPWTLHYRYTNRLLIGPFPTSDAAQDWVSDRKKEGFATFRVETSAGEAVERL